MAGGKSLDSELEGRLRAKIRTDLSPRYVPDKIVQVPGVPKTLNGKKLEVPVKKVMMGGDPAKVLNVGSIQDPGVLDFYVQLARIRAGKSGPTG